MTLRKVRINTLIKFIKFLEIFIINIFYLEILLIYIIGTTNYLSKTFKVIYFHIEIYLKNYYLTKRL